MFYNQDRKNVTQLVPNNVWKVIYVDYKLKFPHFIFQEESLKDKLRDTLKELKTCTTNEKGAKMVVLQSDQVLEQLKSTNGHATWNVLKNDKLLWKVQPIRLIIPLLAFILVLFLTLHQMRQQCCHLYLVPHLWVHQLKNQ